MRKSTFRPFGAAIILMVATMLGCASPGDPGERYVELRIASDTKMQMLIRSDVWRGFVTPHGYGGYAHNIHSWVTLDGPGPVFVDPKFTENSNTQFKHTGEITVNRPSGKVTVNLQKIVSKTGEPLRKEPSSANGIYVIKKVTREPFMPHE
jgi:hypothetical protein